MNIKCPKCGMPIEKKSNKCLYCGCSIMWENVGYASAKKDWKKVLIIVIHILCLYIAGQVVIGITAAMIDISVILSILIAIGLIYMWLKQAKKLYFRNPKIYMIYIITFLAACLPLGIFKIMSDQYMLYQNIGGLLLLFILIWGCIFYPMKKFLLRDSIHK